MRNKTKVNSITNLKKPVVNKKISTLKTGFSGLNSNKLFKTFKELLFNGVITKVDLFDFEERRLRRQQQQRLAIAACVIESLKLQEKKQLQEEILR